MSAFEGVRVAEFAWNWAGPLTGKYLADFGATVVTIESSASVDLCRLFPPHKDNIPGINRAGPFAEVHPNRYGMTLNLKNPRGLEISRRLVSWADIVTESFMPGVMESFGLGYEDMKKIRPDIIMVSTNIHGAGGPLSHLRGQGVILPSLSGHTLLFGWPDRMPSGVPQTYTDHIAPRFAAATIMAALDYRRRTGKGQYLEFSQLECAIHFLAPLFLDCSVNGRIAQRNGNRCPYAAPHGAYPCRGEDRWCAIAVFTDEEWQSFCRVIGSPAWTTEARFTTLRGRKENEDELDRLVADWTVKFAAEEVMAKLQAAGVPAGVLQNGRDLLNDPHLNQRGFFTWLEHSEIGAHVYDREGIILSETPAELRMAAPCLGEHTEYVVTEILGLSDEEYGELLADGAFK